MVEMEGPARWGPTRAFVGRDRELADLVAGLEDAIAGRVRLLLIAGEPGIGKTWLAQHLAGQAAERGVRVQWVRCWEAGGAPPFWPWTQLLQVLGEGLDDQTMAAWLGTGAAQVAQLVPGLGGRLGTTALPPPPARASDAARFSLYDAVTGFLREAAAEQPLLLVLEDLQAADASSLLLLEFLARDLRGGRLLVVGTYRDVTADRVHGGGDVTVPDPGRLRVPLSGSVRTAIGRRLAPLSADAVQVLSVAAVVGREFDLPLLGPACELPMERILGGLSEAVALDVVTEGEGATGRYRFSYSLVREVLYERLPIPARVDLHRRVGESIERQYGGGPASHVAELAHHFAEAAAAGGAAKALAYARLAGERAMDLHAHEEAAVQYRRALQTLRFAGPDEPVRCELLLRLGAALSRAGRFREAEESCLEAAELSRRLGSSERLAQAALVFGARELGGGEVNRRLVALLREALDAVPASDSPLRARLLARLSLELTFSDEAELAGPISREAVELSRRLGDAAALAGALRARWMAVWGPDGLEERSALAEELLRLARATGDQELELAGRGRRATSALQSGDIRVVEPDVMACARLAEGLHMPAHRWMASTMRAMLALLQGSLGEAEALAEEARALQPDGPNTAFAYNDLIEALRWAQGRLPELRPAWREQLVSIPWSAWPRLWLAMTDADLGNEAAARRSLQHLADGLLRRPRDGLWPPAMAVAALVAARLREPVAAGHLYKGLLPYRTQVIVVAMPHPVVCLGSASFYLGLLAAVTSSWQEAGDHFEVAIAVHQRLGARALLARSHHEYARMLLARGQVADRRRVADLLDQALATAGTLGMATLAEEIRTLQRGETSRAAPAGEDATAARNLFRQEGEYWTVRYDGAVVRLKDAKGLHHLARLLAHPGQEFHAIDLEAAGGQAAPGGPRSRAGDGELVVRPDLGDAGELLDATAKAAYKARLDELQAELEEAEGFNDPVRAAKARAELDFLTDELARAVGLSGRDRRAASHAERARLNATRAIRTAMGNLARANPALGRHLTSTIRTGRYCSYTPDPRVPITWER